MSSKKLLLIIVLIILVGWGVGIVLTPKKNQLNISNSQVDRLVNKELNFSIPSPTAGPSPTPTPIPERTEFVKKIDDKFITVSSKKNDLLIPKDYAKVTVYKRTKNDLVKATFEDIILNQSVTLKFINQGQQLELILE